MLKLRLAAEQMGTGEMVLQVAQQPFGIITQQNGADAFRATGHQNEMAPEIRTE
ncbi:hypothetical protein GCM10027396_18720 [Insolitispirillum peregrinum]